MGIEKMQIPANLSKLLDDYAQANRDLGYGVSIHEVKALRAKIDEHIKRAMYHAVLQHGG